MRLARMAGVGGDEAIGMEYDAANAEHPQGALPLLVTQVRPSISRARSGDDNEVPQVPGVHRLRIRACGHLLADRQVASLSCVQPHKMGMPAMVSHGIALEDRL